MPTKTDEVTSAAIKRAIEGRDGPALASFYADDAVLRIVDRNNPPSRPREVKGRSAINTFWDDICSRAMTHKVETSITEGDRLAFTTDSYVVDPLFFAGGDIGRLAVAGTVNDLAVGGARPVFLSCAIIAEEGLDIALLRRVARSMQDTAAEAGVKIVTGDTKVVPRGAADKLFVNTAGLGVIAAGVSIAEIGRAHV